MAVILSCSVQNFKTIGQLKGIWTNEISRDLSLVWVATRNPISFFLAAITTNIMRRFMCTCGNCCSSSAYTITISYENKLLLLLLFILFLLKWYYNFHYYYNYYYHCFYHNHYHYYHHCHPHHRHHVSVILNYQPLTLQGLDLVLQQSNQMQRNITHSSTAINATCISDFWRAKYGKPY